MSDVDVLRLLDAIQVFERKINLALMYYGLRLPQYRVLDSLDKAGKITVSDLSRKLDVTRATMSVLVTKMQKAGLVVYLDNKVDKRSFYIKLTEAGSARLRSAEQAFHLMQKNMSQSLPEDIIDALNTFSLGVQHGSIR
jgi:DNA-binding MarR family transcriptional regulator